MIDNSVKIIKHKVGLLNLAEELGNVSRACKVMGLSRDTFYRYKSAVESGGVEALFDQTRRKPNHKNRVEEPIELAVKDYACQSASKIDPLSALKIDPSAIDRMQNIDTVNFLF